MEEQEGWLRIRAGLMALSEKGRDWQEVSRRQRVKIALYLKGESSVPQKQELDKKPFKCSWLQQEPTDTSQVQPAKAKCREPAGSSSRCRHVLTVQALWPPRA